MKIGLVIYGELDQRSGGYFYDWQLVRHLERAGDQVTVFSLPERSNYIGRITDNWKWDFWRRLAHADIDVLLQDELNHLSLFITNWWLRTRVDYPIVSIIHHLYSKVPRAKWENQVYKFIELIYLASIDGIICNSSTTIEAVQEISNLPDHVVAPPGNDHITSIKKWEGSANQKKSKLDILFVGNVTPRKQVHTLVKAVGRTDGDFIKLNIVGSNDVDPRYVRRVTDVISKANLGATVTLHGRVSSEDLKRFLAACDVLVVPSTYEGFGIVYMEAMAYGKPVIAGYNGHPQKLIEESRAGFLVEPGNEIELAEKLTTLAKSPSLRERMRSHALRYSEQHPSWKESMSKVRTFLHNMVAPSNAGD